MKVCIVGASGKLGRYMVEHALVRDDDMPPEAAAVLGNAARAGLAVELVALEPGEEPDWGCLPSQVARTETPPDAYAAWADQAKGKHGCRKGQARTTGQTAAGNQESGTASSQKVKAAALWNTIASKYGLTQRQPTQL